MRQEPVRPLHPVDLSDLGAAYSARQNPHENLAQLDGGYLDLLDLEGAALLDENRCAGFHGSLGWQAAAIPYTGAGVGGTFRRTDRMVYDKIGRE